MLHHKNVSSVGFFCGAVLVTIFLENGTISTRLAFTTYSSWIDGDGVGVVPTTPTFVANTLLDAYDRALTTSQLVSLFRDGVA